MASARGTIMNGSDTDEDRGGDQSTLCIVLACEGGPLSPRVHAEIASRQWQTIETHDPLDAMLRLCLLERMQTTRAGWGLPRLHSLAILIVSDGHHSAISQVADAVQRHLPAVSIWKFHSAQGLRAVAGGCDSRCQFAAAESQHAAEQKSGDRRCDATAIIDRLAPASNSGQQRAERPAALPVSAAASPHVAEVRHDDWMDHANVAAPPVRSKNGEQSPSPDDTVDIESTAITRQEIAMLLEMENSELDS